MFLFCESPLHCEEFNEDKRQIRDLKSKSEDDDCHLVRGLIRRTIFVSGPEGPLSNSRRVSCKRE